MKLLIDKKLDKAAKSREFEYFSRIVVVRSQHRESPQKSITIEKFDFNELQKIKDVIIED